MAIRIQSLSSEDIFAFLPLQVVGTRCELHLCASTRMGLRFKGPPSSSYAPPLLLLRPDLFSSSSSVYLVHTLRDREVCVKFGLLLHSTDEGKLSHGTATYKAKACSFGQVQSVERIKVNLDNCTSKICQDVAKQILKGEDSSFIHTNLTLKTAAELALLMENIDRIEDLIVGADMIRLERDILTHLRRLGAMKLFTSCFSKAVTETIIWSSNLVNKHLDAYPFELRFDEKKDNIVVHSNKKEQRKKRRAQRLEKVSRRSVLQIPTESGHKDELFSLRKRGLGNFAGLSGSKKREVIAKNESEMSMGVKEMANLEKLCKNLEEDMGKPPSLTRWAEAAGLDQKTLRSRLQFGWYCRDKLIRSTRSLVIFVAKNYRGMGIAFDDLIQAGYVGVLNGTERYDIEKGYRFSTYVQYWIRKSILAMIASHSRTVKVRMESMINQIQKVKRNFHTSEGKYPNDEEITELTGLSLAYVRLASRCSKSVGSIEQEVRDGWTTTFMFLLCQEITADTSVKSPYEFIGKEHAREQILNLLQTLHPRERQVLALRYGLGDGRCRSLEEIGRLCHVSREWIRKIEKEALSKIRSQEMQKRLSHYLQ
ncbi:RNA polymerase sigma factor sigC-like isoform X2 [Zingiber officinale]|uniref:RNA polymerase sigma factor sigC-like isoform X2 n=1 Tax=Zingiber officinale TaxID=94328 RepID=UPI001C4AA02A|nr:RNA polymerase sigma factor sigC-like isoform X2 [Zingiber officinale]